jgi:hypothetical protein
MFVSVPVLRLAAIARRHKSADIPLTTDAAAYHDVARKICEVLNRHGFSFERAAPGWWVAAPTRILGALGGDAFRAYVPDQLEHFVSGDLEMSLYPSGILLRGAPGRLTWAHGLIAETATHTAGLQTTTPKAQELERRLRQLWNSYDAGQRAGGGPRDLELKLDQITSDLGQLDVAFDDWQVLYRQILQLGRVIHGERQLLDAQATAAGDRTDFAGKTEPSLSPPSELWDPRVPENPGRMHFADAREASKPAPPRPNRAGDSALSAAMSAPMKRGMAFAGGALLPLTSVLFLTHLIPAWAAGLVAGGFAAAIGVVVVLVAERRPSPHSGAAGNA